MDKNEKFFLGTFLNLLRTGKPRVIKRARGRSTLIFTDACCERDAESWCCGLGGVLVDPNDEVRRQFSLELDERQRELLGELRKQQIIFEAETIAALVALFFGKIAATMTSVS